MRDRTVGDPAWVHVPEEAQVGVHVEGEPVRRDAPGHTDPDGRHLALFGPHPCVTRLGPRRHAEIGEDSDDSLLDASHMGNDLLGIPQPDNRVPDKLTGPVVGDVPPAVDPVHLCPERDQRLLGDEEVRAIAVAAHRVDVGMLQQQQVVVVGAPLHPTLPQRPLQVPGLQIREPPQPANPQKGPSLGASVPPQERRDPLRSSG